MKGSKAEKHDEDKQAEDAAKSLAPSGGETSPAAAPAAAAPAGPVVKMDETTIMASYANFARVTGTPEELIVDFGLNPDPFNQAGTPIVMNQRIILNFYTAKRLLAALHMTVERHEAAFGALEVDVQKRVTAHGGAR